MYRRAPLSAVSGTASGHFNGENSHAHEEARCRPDIAEITLGAAAVLATGPAQAAGTVATTAKLTMNQQTTVKGQYGDAIGYLEATVADPLGGLVYTGSAVLQRRLPGRSWADVKTDPDTTDGVRFDSYGSHAKGNVRYRFHYLGGTDPDTSTTYDPSYSNVVTVITLWNFKDTSACPHGRCHISGHLIPRTARHKITVQVKHGSWQRYRVVRTTSRGAYRIGVTGSRSGTKYRMIIARTRSITATSKRYRVIRVTAQNAAGAISPR
jgi:hypothetical protein